MLNSAARLAEWANGLYATPEELVRFYSTTPRAKLLFFEGGNLFAVEEKMPGMITHHEVLRQSGIGFSSVLLAGILRIPKPDTINVELGSGIESYRIRTQESFGRDGNMHGALAQVLQGSFPYVFVDPKKLNY